jgi:hypothetical protein
MAIVSITKAVKLTGKSAPTIYRHIKQGKVSRTPDGLDTSELLRVYGSLVGDEGVSVQEENPIKLSQHEITETEIKSLKHQLEEQTKLVSYLKGEIQDHKKEKADLIQVMKQLPAPDGESIVSKVRKFWK